jgi:ribosomal protein L7Ae-like RNA K-turn-binding protein
MAETHQPRDAAGRALALVGLGMHGGMVVPGVEGTRALLQRGKCYVVMVARDLSPRARMKVELLARAKQVPVVVGPGAGLIGERLGRPPVMVVGVRDRKLAAGILAAIASGDRT